jgi:hypothetical protein
MTSITITRALAQVKSLNDRIERATRESFVTTLTGGKHATGKAKAEVETSLKANLQSVQALITERNKVKAAIIRSNAVTKVSVNGVEQTVAEAIERKGSIQLEKALLQQLRLQLAQQSAKVERENVLVATRLDQLIQTTVGKDRKVDEAEVAAITGPFEAKNKAELLDPSDVSAIADKLQREIEDFELDVDHALSEVNAITRITV